MKDGSEGIAHGPGRVDVNDEQHAGLGRPLDELREEVGQIRTELGQFHGNVLKAIDGRGEN